MYRKFETQESLVEGGYVSDTGEGNLDLGTSFDLVILHSKDGEINVWNPFLAEPWKLEHQGHSTFERPMFLPNRTGFVTTSRKSTENILKDVRVFVCRSVFWQDTKKRQYMKLTSYRVPLFSYFPGIETRAYESLRSFTVFWDVRQNGILFYSSLIGSIAITYTGKKLKPALHPKENIIGQFSDSARVIYFKGLTAYDRSYVKIMKNDKVCFELRQSRCFDGIPLFLDTYLVIVDQDINFPRLPCRIRIFTRAGGLIYELRLGSKYASYYTRIFEEGHSIVIYAKDLSEATVWNSGETSQALSVARCEPIKRANENPEARYNLRSTVRRIF
ncbi:hypothetical protein N7505_007791 [Penicillium chrysogenum]|uniref:Uncharacterized protein n=1 Tax=Penicillium chrysogenum TaxID=5076 RepID=A0ABQ8WF07_PENCH|nr:hypothetical protein N7505_007791 [Penicillium chrysogenum]